MGAVGDAGCFGAAEQAEGTKCTFPVLRESVALLRWGQERSRDASRPQREPSVEGFSSENKAFLSSSELLPWSKMSRGVQTATCLADTQVGPMLGSLFSPLWWRSGFILEWEPPSHDTSTCDGRGWAGLVIPCPVILNAWEQYSFFSVVFTLPLLQIPFLSYAIRIFPSLCPPACLGCPSEGHGLPNVVQAETKQADGLHSLSPPLSRPCTELRGMCRWTVNDSGAHPAPPAATSWVVSGFRGLGLETGPLAIQLKQVRSS